ncbi:MAG TPA: NAD(P)H-dependent oxidoreductase [Methanocorpusculum sp.]|nr:NAD(P)H-dependent oxidoreductase [Candidatus Methanocorpusculum equi]MCQ2357431.1 NAD(P)H-dependent oxidoreductase [Methanocorpusculum sp.]HJJ33354.1 NAD(P)H-dependent oxidoreductase [Methanocorpusculum sp.]HJJ44229.1 NAD(P)H-dependent oxidoreductase [Methanocorpusculum sp.]HJJ58657.1 NAD(P)H-dependent oxidoreductase [Methanocorpusculum sp.]
MTKMIAAVFGSNILGGNTDKLLMEAIRGAEDAGCTIERINAAHIGVSPCMQTFGCMAEPHCFVDDKAEKYYRILKKCDGVIVATPVMTYGIPGALKSFMDRCQPFYMAKYYRKQPLVTREHAKIRKMLFICIGGMNNEDIFTGPRLTAKAFGEIIDAKYSDELLQNNMDEIKSIENKPDVLKAAYEKGYALGKGISDARDNTA